VQECIHYVGCLIGVFLLFCGICQRSAVWEWSSGCSTFMILVSVFVASFLLMFCSLLFTRLLCDKQEHMHLLQARYIEIHDR
jgi:hypothetical protein